MDISRYPWAFTGVAGQPLERYTGNMAMGITYNQSAFKHGLTEADIEWAFLHPICNGLLEDYENKYLLVGFDSRGNPIEVMYNRIDSDQVNVFHAMKCRKSFLPHDLLYFV